MKKINGVVKILLVLTLPIIIAFVPLLVLATTVACITPATFQGVCSSAPFWVTFVILAIGCFIAIGQELFD
jgi:small-conductance mechanosensitive channel